jgi:tetratricopeptide (TPR) repeat protein
MEKDPVHRYASAGALAEDLRRFLEDRPILARRASLTERTRRWSRRNRLTAALAATAAGSLLLAAVVGWAGYVITTRALKGEQQRRIEGEIATRLAREATHRAEENVALSLDVFEELFGMLAAHDSHLLPPPPGLPRVQFGAPSGPHGEPFSRPPPPPRGPDDSFDHQPPPPGEGHRPLQPGRPEALSALIQSMLRFYDRFAQRNETNPRLQGEVAWAYRIVGALHARLGRAAEAESAYQRSIDMFEELIVRFPKVPEFRAKLVETSIMADPWSAYPASLKRLEKQLRRAQVVIDQLGDESPEDLGYLQDRVHVHAKLGAVLQRLSRETDAADSYRRAIASGSSLIDLSLDSSRARLDRAYIQEALAMLQLQRGQQGEARRLLNAAAADMRSLPDLDSMFSPPPESFEKLAEAFKMLGDTERAEEISRWAAEARARPRDLRWPQWRGPRPASTTADPPRSD